MYFFLKRADLIGCLCFYYTECGDWKFFNNNCYRLINKELDWNSARKHCYSTKSKLVSIHSEEEMTFLKQQVVRGSNWNGGASFGIWIGGYEISGDWKWDDGSKFHWETWQENQPNAPSWDDKIPDCAYLSTGERYEWADASCKDYSFPFICQS